MDLPRPLNDWSRTRDGVPGISVRQHLLAVACVTEALPRRYPRLCDRCGITAQALFFLAARHDVGKLSLDFLQKSSVWLARQGLTERVPHTCGDKLFKDSLHLVVRRQHGGAKQQYDRFHEYFSIVTSVSV